MCLLLGWVSSAEQGLMAGTWLSLQARAVPSGLGRVPPASPFPPKVQTGSHQEAREAQLSWQTRSPAFVATAAPHPGSPHPGSPQPQPRLALLCPPRLFLMLCLLPPSRGRFHRQGCGAQRLGLSLAWPWRSQAGPGLAAVAVLGVMVGRAKTAPGSRVFPWLGPHACHSDSHCQPGGAGHTGRFSQFTA